MLETPHVLAGAAIATKIPDPLLALPLALASHFILDKVPHWNPHLNTETEKFGHPTRRSTIITAIDSLIALASGSYFAYQALPNTTQAIAILAACFLAVLPDVVEAPYFFLNYRKKIIKNWVLWQRSIQANSPPLPGLLTQLFVSLTIIFWGFS
jgi:hypothetical protein